MARKKSYGDLKRQIEALVAQKKEMEEQAVNAFTEALMSSSAREKLAVLSNADLQAVARRVAADIDNVIAAICK